MEQGAAKIRVKLGQVEVEYEGDFAFLRQGLAPMVSDLIRLYKENQDTVDAPNNGAEGSAERAVNSTPETPTRKKRRAGGKPPEGTSCRARILELKKEKFFKDQRSPSEIIVGLRGKGWTYKSNQVGATLTIMFEKGEIQRTGGGPDGKFKYFWDRD